MADLSWVGAPGYEIGREILQRGVAAIAAVAFWSTLRQFPALLGEHGLLPVPRLLATVGPRGPSLFRWGYTDRRLRVLALTGVAVSALLVVGVPQAGPPWLPLLAFVLLYVLYLSVVHVGQTFYGFGWEMLLCEALLTVSLLGSTDQPASWAALVLVWWLVIRLELGAGLIKIRGGPEWRDLTALMYHHETQPMPGPLSRQAHLLPAWFHRVEVVGNHVTQLALPVLLLVPGPVASVAAAVMVVTQLWLVVTGNFAWLNWLAIVLAASAITDAAWATVLPALGPDAADPAPMPVAWAVVTLVGAALVLGASWPALRNLFSRHQLMNAAFNPWMVANAYGAFGTVTKRRVEIVVEGTEAADPADDDWRAYEFPGKPGDPRRVPRQWAPYHLRLDWMMWFLPLGRISAPWFHAFLGALLRADPAVLRLLRHDPFEGRPPRWVRAQAYRYRFATRAERRRDGLVWERTLQGTVVGPVRLR
ncbi:lipase maturation factor family protein [Cellulomonas massiliensis]|uniref:lipase maturation factor family protein n=1 Tax=Cellulomonas massiliensis TaxID=1465811 RepID=UPI00030365D9|nr:lipase maturation factor family protein [Cellulomonas massiliensis]